MAECIVLNNEFAANIVRRRFEVRNIRLKIFRLRQAGFDGLIDGRDADALTDDEIADGPEWRIPGFLRGTNRLATRTFPERWCNGPEQRLDGKFFIKLPDPGRGRQFFLNGIPEQINYTVETYDPAWVSYPTDIQPEG